MSPDGRVLIVTVTYDSGGHLEKFLASVPAATNRPYTVVVVDNGSTDGAPRAAALADPDLSLLELDDNVGYGSAINAAVKGLAADVDWILVANPDTELAPGSVDALVDEGVRDARIGALGPAITDEAGVPYPSARRFPSIVSGTGHALFARIWKNNPWSTAYLMAGVEGGSRDVDWLSGACLLVRREAFVDVEGFDEGYFMYFEDVDLSLRLHRAGWLRRFVPSASIVHVGAHSTSGRRAAMVRAHHVSAGRFVDTLYPGPLAAPLRLVVHVGLRVRAALLSRHGAP